MKGNNINLKLSEYLELIEFKKNILDGKKCVETSNSFGDYCHSCYYTDDKIVEKLTTKLGDSAKKIDHAKSQIKEHQELEREAIFMCNQMSILLNKVPRWIRWIFSAN